MPQVEMPSKEPEPQLPETSDKDILDKVIDNMDNSEKIPVIRSEIVEVEEREVPSEDEVFGEPPEVKPLKEEEFPVSTEFDVDGQGKPKKRKYTRKQPMTQKQKDHLARIRKIAQEKRQKEKERKEKEKEEAQLKKVEERLLKKKQKEEQQNEEQESPPPAQPKSRSKFNDDVEFKEKQPQELDKHYQQQMFSQADLDKAMLNAVATYDQYRKVQKKEKKKKQAEEAEQARMKRTIQNAITPQQTAAANDPWRSLFT